MIADLSSPITVSVAAHRRVAGGQLRGGVGLPVRQRGGQRVQFIPGAVAAGDRTSYSTTRTGMQQAPSDRNDA